MKSLVGYEPRDSHVIVQMDNTYVFGCPGKGGS